ncbi:TetR/AcrR family transcriptional regulator [Actinophytocola oryzae]|uniref:TetR family transcriptional regulator n=1 Tax=Actinophytocola oryzae TaxID=502181 RepID=A0A4R7W310_9PSEU|nr:TetR/AcrR family transcriptional regulator [Actinophytocola oryzae]TDV55977.1 TetR family transcriptional regulator [Actinophytocola oryzae]
MQTGETSRVGSWDATGEAARAPRAGVTSVDSRGEATRNTIIEVAVRLFAEQGVLAVSNRQIGAAAGRGNTSVVGYYFANKADLVRAVMRRFMERVSVGRERRIAQLGDAPDLRGWVTCLVFPYTELLDAEGPPTWHARFIAQVLTDPGLRETAVEEATSQPIQRILDGLRECLPDLPDRVLEDRSRIASHVIVQMCAERERSLADGQPVHPPTWDEAATGLVDVLVGMWTAPVTTTED